MTSGRPCGNDHSRGADAKGKRRILDSAEASTKSDFHFLWVSYVFNQKVIKSKDPRPPIVKSNKHGVKKASAGPAILWHRCGA